MLSNYSSICLFVTLWSVAGQAPLSVGFSRQEYWSGLPFPPPGDLPDPGIEPTSLMSPALAGRFFTSNATWEALSPWYWQGNWGSEAAIVMNLVGSMWDLVGYTLLKIFLPIISLLYVFTSLYKCCQSLWRIFTPVMFLSPFLYISKCLISVYEHLTHIYPFSYWEIFWVQIWLYFNKHLCTHLLICP